MIYFLDMKFIETGALPDLVSIALVSDDGREYYAVVSEFEAKRALLCGQGRILPLLSHVSEQKPRKVIRNEIERFIIGKGTAEIWADFSTYYFILFTQLWGSLFDIPNNIRMYDIQQVLSFRGESVPKQILPLYHALDSARRVRDVYMEYIQGRRAGREYQIGDIVEINKPMPFSIVSNRYRGIGVVVGWEGEELVIVNVIDENGKPSVFRVVLHYTNLHLLYRR